MINTVSPNPNPIQLFLFHYTANYIFNSSESNFHHKVSSDVILSLDYMSDMLKAISSDELLLSSEEMLLLLFTDLISSEEILALKDPL